VVVEGDAGGDHVQHRGPREGEGGLEQHLELPLVGGEGAGDEAAAELDGERADVHRLEGVLLPAPEPRAPVGGGGELPLGEPVDPLFSTT